MYPIPTLLRVTAFTDRGTFTRTHSGCWTADQRAEEMETLREVFLSSLHRSGIVRVQLRTDVFGESPLFGWVEVEA